MKEKCAKNLYDIETSYTSCTIVASRTNEDTDEEQQKGKKSHILLPMLLFMQGILLRGAFRFNNVYILP